MPELMEKATKLRYQVAELPEVVAGNEANVAVMSS